MKQDIRMDQVEKKLTPKQAVTLWLQEIQHFESPYDYLRHLRDTGYESPIKRISAQIEQAVRNEMKGGKAPVVEAAVRQAIRDVVFLVKLAYQVNFGVMLEQGKWKLSQIALAETLHGLIVEDSFRNILGITANQIDMDMPYPLDPEMAAVVDAAVKNHVCTWEQFEEQGDIEDWLYRYFVEHGAKELPDDCHELVGFEYRPRVGEDNEKEVRACFENDAEFQKFRTGEDYHHGLGTVDDAVWNRHYERMVSKLHDLVDSGQVQAGFMVNLESVPVYFLQEAPLLEGEWLDSKVAELALWGKLIQAKGYKLDERDTHFLSVNHFLDSDGKEVETDELNSLREKAILKLARFTGRTKNSGGGLYVHIEDFSKMLGKGKAGAQVQRGFILSVWDRWVNTQGGEGNAVLVDVPVFLLSCYAEDSYYLSRKGVSEQVKREQALNSLRILNRSREKEEDVIVVWKDAVNYCLSEIYTYKGAVESISKRFFDGIPVLFPEVDKNLNKTIKDFEESIDRFNGVLGREAEGLNSKLNAGEIQEASKKNRPPLVSLFVDQSKAETFDYFGDYKTSLEITDRYW